MSKKGGVQEKKYNFFNFKLKIRGYYQQKVNLSKNRLLILKL